MNILYNSDGYPLMMTSSLVFGETVGLPSSDEIKRKSIIMPYDMTIGGTYIDVNGYKVKPWGVSNDFPQLAAKEIESTSVLNTGLKFLRNLTLGQGIYPCTVTGYDDDGNELLAPVIDANLKRFINSRMVRRYMEKVLRDYLKQHPIGSIYELLQAYNVPTEHNMPQLSTKPVYLISPVPYFQFQIPLLTGHTASDHTIISKTILSHLYPDKT